MPSGPMIPSAWPRPTPCDGKLETGYDPLIAKAFRLEGVEAPVLASSAVGILRFYAYELSMIDVTDVDIVSVAECQGGMDVVSRWSIRLLETATNTSAFATIVGCSTAAAARSSTAKASAAFSHPRRQLVSSEPSQQAKLSARIRGPATLASPTRLHSNNTASSNPPATVAGEPATTGINCCIPTGISEYARGVKSWRRAAPARKASSRPSGALFTTSSGATR